MNKITKYFFLGMLLVAGLFYSSITLADASLYYPPASLVCTPGKDLMFTCTGYDAAYLRPRRTERGLARDVFYFDSARTFDIYGQNFEYSYKNKQGAKISFIGTYWTIRAAVEKGDWEGNDDLRIYTCKGNSNRCPFTDTPYVD